MVLARGKVHVEVMPEGWQVNGDGLATFVQRLGRVLRGMLGPGVPLPRTMFTDRGTGMYIPSGQVVEKYKSAALEGGFKLYWGDDASMQSPDMGDVLLHETAVAWFRKLMQKQLPECAPWEETPLAWAKRARRAVLHINENFDVPALCREFPTRLHALASGSGERLRK